MLTEQQRSAVTITAMLEHDFRLTYRNAINIGADTNSLEMQALERMVIEYSLCQSAITDWANKKPITGEQMRALKHTSRSLVRDVIEPYENGQMEEEHRDEAFHKLAIAFRDEVRLIVAAGESD